MNSVLSKQKFKRLCVQTLLLKKIQKRNHTISKNGRRRKIKSIEQMRERENGNTIRLCSRLAACFVFKYKKNTQVTKRVKVHEFDSRTLRRDLESKSWMLRLHLKQRKGRAIW